MACFSMLQYNILPHSSPTGMSAISHRIMNYLSNRGARHSLVAMMHHLFGCVLTSDLLVLRELPTDFGLFNTVIPATEAQVYF